MNVFMVRMSIEHIYDTNCLILIHNIVTIMLQDCQILPPVPFRQTLPKGLQGSTHLDLHGH